MPREGSRDGSRGRSVAVLAGAFLVLSIVSGGALAEDALSVPAGAIEQPSRPFGRVVGDVLVQRVVVDAGPLAAEAADALTPGRIDAWFERLPARVVEVGSGRQAIELRHQLVNAPTEARVVRLPALPLVVGDVTIEVPEWPIGIGPLTPREVAEEGGLPAFRPDRRLPLVDTSAERARLRATLLALAASALAWLGWWTWRRRSERVRLPFARARHALRSIPAAARDDAPEAWTALHRALDDTAGGTVHRGSLGRLIAAAPWLAAFRADIERFYAASAARFFSQPARDEPFAVGELARTLYRAEKRQAR